MQLLRTITQQDIEPTAPSVDSSTYASRKAVRAVLLGHDNEIHLVHVANFNYHKLPGGGIDDGEDIIDALKRELLEEVGCDADVLEEVGEVFEVRDFEKLNQSSYCYIARQTGEQKSANLEDYEIEEGMVGMTAVSIEDAIELLKNDQPSNVEGAFIQQRDLCLLRAAKSLL